MHIHRIFFPLTLFAAFTLAQQPADPTAERVSPDSPLDPLALQVLQATTDTVKNAKVFSFHAIVQRDTLGSNDQILTFIRRNDVTISRPNKVRMIVTGAQQTAEVYYNNGEIFLYSPKENVYAGVGTSTLDLDRLVDQLEERGVELPMSPLFRSDPYRTLTDGLKSAYVIGRVDIDGKTFHHLAFTEADADWQLWVEGGSRPTPRRAQIIYKTLPQQPRVVVDFTDWNFSPEITTDTFVFKKPSDAKAISTVGTAEVKQQ